eukprot:TRINITY_DN336_c2_g1_i1.p1 TRINITY_DN336_c2_g1~~TRINITY_DN336_c2_g1_i1.p1  ORF type:complete len:107 (+),score=4.56 TRINITY_DN336_c2_g1_i1:347-667(+)
MEGDYFLINGNGSTVSSSTRPRILFRDSNNSRGADSWYYRNKKAVVPVHSLQPVVGRSKPLKFLTVCFLPLRVSAPGATAEIMLLSKAPQLPIPTPSPRIIASACS